MRFPPSISSVSSDNDFLPPIFCCSLNVFEVIRYISELFAPSLHTYEAHFGKAKLTKLCTFPPLHRFTVLISTLALTMATKECCSNILRESSILRLATRCLALRAFDNFRSIAGNNSSQVARASSEEALAKPLFMSIYNQGEQVLEQGR